MAKIRGSKLPGHKDEYSKNRKKLWHSCSNSSPQQEDQESKKYSVGIDGHVDPPLSTPCLSFFLTQWKSEEPETTSWQQSSVQQLFNQN